MGTIERRQRRRIITLKNFRWVLAVAIVVLVALSLDFSMRGKSASDYGRLYRNRIEPTEGVKPRPPVIVEAPPVTDDTAADPLLLVPAAREQEFLSTTEQRPAPIAMGVPIVAPNSGSGSGVAIVGDSGGVVLVRGNENAKQPVLAGGIFKQP